VLVLLLPVWAFAAPVQCECARALRELAGVNLPRGDASKQVPNLGFRNLDVHDVLLMRYGNTFHVAEVVGFSETKGIVNGYIAPISILIQEWNFRPCAYSQRLIPLLDDHIWGVYRPPI